MNTASVTSIQSRDSSPVHLATLPELNYGIANCNNVFSATMTVFTVLLGEGWIKLLYIVSSL